MIGRLRKFDTLTIERPVDGGYFEGNKYIKAENKQVKVVGNWQPYYIDATTGTAVSDGLKATDTYLLFTKDKIQTVDQFSKESADYYIFNGQEYVAMEVVNHSKHKSLILWHHQIMFVRRDSL